MSCKHSVRTWRKANNGYITGDCLLCHKTVTQHSFVWVQANGPVPPGLEIDHINRDRTDNRLENLRIVTSGQNKANSPPRSASGFKGVYPVRAKRLRKELWMAQVKRCGITHHVGVFATPSEAAEAREKFIAEKLPW